MSLLVLGLMVPVAIPPSAMELSVVADLASITQVVAVRASFRFQLPIR